MNYKAVFSAAKELNRKIDIKYYVCEDKNCFYIESFVQGGDFFEKVLAWNKNEEETTELAKLFAEKGVHPVHTADIINDMIL